jgi:hypothetical protein
MSTLSKTITTGANAGTTFNLGFTAQVNFQTAPSGGQILQSWWSPMWATGTDVYANYICQMTKTSSGASYKDEVWNTDTDIVTKNAGKVAAATFSGT